MDWGWQLTEPRNHAADEVACRQRDVEVERLHLGPASSLHEHDSVAEDGVSAEDLGSPDDGVDLGTAQVGPFEALEVARTLALLELEVGGVHNIGKFGAAVFVRSRLGGEAVEIFECNVELSTAH